MTSAYKILVGKLQGRRPLWRPKQRWEDNIKMNFTGILCRCVLYSNDSGYDPNSRIL